MKYKILIISILSAFNFLLGQQIYQEKASLLQQAANSIVVLKNAKDILPIKNLENKRFAYVSLENLESEIFYTYLKKYTNFEKITVKTLFDVTKLKGFDYVIIAVDSKQTASSKLIKQLIYQISTQNATILASFGNFEALISNLDTNKIQGILLAPEIKNTLGISQHDDYQLIIPQVIFGARASVGKLTQDINNFKSGQGIELQAIKRLAYGYPEEVGMQTEKLNKIDEIAQKALTINAVPGMQILVARKGKVVFEKSYGYTDLTRNQLVSNENIYDIASISKIAGTMPMVFKMKDDGVLSYEQTLGSKLPSAMGTNKENLTFREILTHQSGLKAWIPFYEKTLDTLSFPSGKYYSKEAKVGFTNKVADQLFIQNTYTDSIYKVIYQSPLGAKKYEYSDLGLFLTKEVIENQYHSSLDILTTNNFFKPLGANTLRYNPLNTLDKSLIVPSERDSYFRYQLIQGYVHDPGAAMQGGVAGHAGLFSNANDLAKLMQMYLQKGYYGGKQYIQENTILEAIQTQYKSNGNRRGIGFDKKPLDGRDGQTCKSATANVFGHSGFTGTIVWMDPDQELLYIFLSNRLISNPKVNILSKQNIRENIFQAIYDAID